MPPPPTTGNPRYVRPSGAAARAPGAPKTIDVAAATAAAAAAAAAIGKGGVQIALDPAELDRLDQDTLTKRYEAQVAATKSEKEDFSDLIDEQERKRKRKADGDGGTKKKGKEFKF